MNSGQNNQNKDRDNLFFNNTQIFDDSNSSFNDMYNQINSSLNSVNNVVNGSNTNIVNSNVNMSDSSNQISETKNNYVGINNDFYNQNSNLVNQDVFFGNGLSYQSSDKIVVQNQVNNVNSVDNESSLNTNQDINNGVIDVEFTTKNNNNSKSNWFISFMTNKKFLFVLIIFIFIFTSITVCRTIYFKNKVDDYEEFFVDIEYKQSNETIVYNGSNEDLGDLKTGAASELVNCIKTPLKINEIPDSISSIIDEINSYYNQSNNHFSFKYKDIYTGFSVSYNENQSIFVASTIKAPKDIYLYEMASLGKIDLNTKLTYTNNYYNTGSGILRNNKFGTEYTVKELLRYSTVISDNAAHNMLMDKYGRENMLAFWKEKGTNTIFTQHSNWGVFNAHDAIIYMEELYNFYIENEVYGQELMNNFLNASPKFINRKDGTKIANKSGWGGSAIHDVSIIFDENPYIIAALSNLGKTTTYMNYFNKASDLAQRLHTEYWKYKMDICSNIDQY